MAAPGYSRQQHVHGGLLYNLAWQTAQLVVRWMWMSLAILVNNCWFYPAHFNIKSIFVAQILNCVLVNFLTYHHSGCINFSSPTCASTTITSAVAWLHSQHLSEYFLCCLRLPHHLWNQSLWAVPSERREEQISFIQMLRIRTAPFTSPHLIGQVHLTPLTGY